MTTLTTLILLKPHTHAGHDYPVGTSLEADAASAAWLVEHHAAREVPPTDPSTTTATATSRGRTAHKGDLA